MGVPVIPDNVPAPIPALHALYSELTRTNLTLDWCRVDCWRQWLAYRKHQPFTAQDLKVVVAYFKRTRKGGILDGSLKFHKLIGWPDRFEEDLNVALQALRPRAPATQTVVVGTTSRIVPSTGTQDATRPIAEVIEAMRKAATGL